MGKPHSVNDYKLVTFYTVGMFSTAFAQSQERNFQQEKFFTQRSVQPVKSAMHLAAI
jgi:hypothetical protein